MTDPTKTYCVTCNGLPLTKENLSKHRGHQWECTYPESSNTQFYHFNVYVPIEQGTIEFVEAFLEARLSPYEVIYADTFDKEKDLDWKATVEDYKSSVVDPRD